MAKVIIGNKIKELRKQKGLTQDQLAEILGYSGKSVIAHIEKGDADMTYEKMALLLKKFDLDANSLFDGQIMEKKSEEKEPSKPKQKKVKKVAIYIHGLNGSAEEANDFEYLKDQYDVIGIDYQDGNPWEVGPAIKERFEEIIKPYDEVVVIANSIGAFYAYEYLDGSKIKQAFFISPIVSMLQSIIDLMVRYNIKDRELREKQFIELDDGTVLSYDFYQHVSDDEDNWNVPTDVLYGIYDEVVFYSTMIEFLETHPSCKLTVKSDAQHYFHTEEEMQFIKEWILRGLEQ